jgi:hypothetical protein
VLGTQVVPVDGRAYSLFQALACDLIGSKMYPTVHARVGDIVGNLLERHVALLAWNVARSVTRNFSLCHIKSTKL